MSLLRTVAQRLLDQAAAESTQPRAVVVFVLGTNGGTPCMVFADDTDQLAADLGALPTTLADFTAHMTVVGQLKADRPAPPATALTAQKMAAKWVRRAKTSASSDPSTDVVT